MTSYGILNASSGGFNWYGFLIALGILICVAAAYLVARHRGIEGDIVIDIIIFGLPCAILFARIYYVVFDIIDGNHWTFSKFIGLEDKGLQGLAIYGAEIGILIGMALLYLWKRRKKNPENKRISYMQLLDLVFTFVILGQAVGRWGNFANKEAHGYAIKDPSLKWFPMGVQINGVWYYATFFYEFVWNLIGFFILMYSYLGRRKSFDGFNFALYCIYYGAGRVWIEGMREDSLWLVPPTNPATGAGGIRVSQLLSVIIILFGVAYIVQHIVRAKRAKKKIFIFTDRQKLCDDYFEYGKTKLARPMPDIKFMKWEKRLMGIDADDGADGDGSEESDDAEKADGDDKEKNVTPPDGKSDAVNASQSDETPTNEREEVVYEDRWDE